LVPWELGGDIEPVPTRKHYRAGNHTHLLAGVSLVSIVNKHVRVLRNTCHRAGSCPKNCLSSLLGPSSRTHFSMWAVSFLMPRGQSRSTSMRVPSERLEGS